MLGPETSTMGRASAFVDLSRLRKRNKVAYWLRAGRRTVRCVDRHRQAVAARGEDGVTTVVVGRVISPPFSGLFSTDRRQVRNN